MNKFSTQKTQAIRCFWPFDWIMGRHACLGFDVLRKLNSKYKSINVQKGRVDLILEQKKYSPEKIDLAIINGHLERKDIYDLIVQQKYICKFPPTIPKAILLDSYSELTDSLYTFNQGGWSFCCNSSDLKISKKITTDFTSMGLLSFSLLEHYYRRYFEFLSKQSNGAPIIFLHVPMRLEQRDFYLHRNDVIRESIDRLKNSFSNLFPISINEAIVDWNVNASGSKDFYPYHYNELTYAEYARVITLKGLSKVFQQ